MIRSLLVCLLLMGTSVVYAQQFDPTGWTLLGMQKVKTERDRDTIAVGKYEGKFDQLQMVVSGADIELKSMTVVFGNGERFAPPLKHHFREGQRSRPIELPGDNRTIAKIELAYAAARPGDMATVSIYGRDRKGGGASTDAAARPQPQPQQAFDKKGWTRLGAGVVNGKRDRDSIRVGKAKGGFDQLTMVVDNSDLELNGFVIVFTNGKKWSPQVKHSFKEGQRTRVIDLPGKDRAIARIDLAYANTPGGGNAKVEVYARDVGRPAPPPFTPVVWEKKGWAFLGKVTVDGWKDRDRVAVRQAKPFSELMFVVAGSDVKLDKVTVTLGNNEKFEIEKNHSFKEGARIAPIDIPGKLRKVKAVDFAYTNLPGGGRASVEVWGRARNAPARGARAKP